MSEHALASLRIPENIEFSEDARNSLRNKILVSIIGPSRVGRTSLMHTACQLDPSFRVVKPFTSQTPCPTGPLGTHYFLKDTAENYRFLSGQLEQGNVAHITRRASGYLYGVHAGAFTGRYNVMQVPTSDLPAIRRLPFEYHIAVGVSAPVKDWEQRFEQAGYGLDEADQRLNESATDLHWALQDPHTIWLSNPTHQRSLNSRSHGLRTSARMLVSIAVGDEYSTGHSRQQAQGILTTIPDMRSAISRAA